jgi:hypothetical protein
VPPPRNDEDPNIQHSTSNTCRQAGRFKILHFFLNTLRFKINKLPSTAGKIKLISQTVTDVKLIPKVFAENIPINKILISPLKPTSNRAIEGITAMVRNTTLITQKMVSIGTCTPNKLNSKIYCTAKTR